MVQLLTRVFCVLCFMCFVASLLCFLPPNWDIQYSIEAQDVRHKAHGTQEFRILHRVSYILHRSSCILHPASCITFLNCIQPRPHFQAQKHLCLTYSSAFVNKNGHRNHLDPLLSCFLAPKQKGSFKKRKPRTSWTKRSSGRIDYASRCALEDGLERD